MRDDTFTIRRTNDPLDFDGIVEAHQRFYGVEWGVGTVFSAYVRTALAEIVVQGEGGDSGVWVAERGKSLAGSIGVCPRPGRAAQIRVFLVEPRHQGRGVGRALLAAALDFCRERRFDGVYLWTVRGLDAAGRLYREAGFGKTREVTHLQWGKLLTEERYDLSLVKPAVKTPLTSRSG